MLAGAQSAATCLSNDDKTKVMIGDKPVNHYRVIASDPATSLVAVEDAVGGCHLGRALQVVPLPGTALRGGPATFGECRLRSADTGAPVPLVLVLTRCEPAVAARVARGDF
jgi:hypothetical protein